ncbi:helix-turn-helix domain-containing protein [Ottowia beijingensis]|uniref:helix-turn-helix domain-containing protein n=1 Tax=Ottowia beijingensis TaxID=1207057 RepID=UPI0027DA88EB|nr:helix-turn-helix domain-containing protein [Ottowia beijingensis]
MRTKIPRETLTPEEAQTLSRGLKVMDAILAGPPEGLRVIALCRQTGLERGTVYRLLHALQAARYVSVVSRFHYGPGERWGLWGARPSSAKTWPKRCHLCWLA